MDWIAWQDKIIIGFKGAVAIVIGWVGKESVKKIKPAYKSLKNFIKHDDRMNQLQAVDTDLKNKLDALMERVEVNENRFKARLVISKDPYFVIDKDGMLEYANPAWLNLTGLTMEQAQGTGWIDAVPTEEEVKRLQRISERLQKHSGDWDGNTYIQNVITKEIYKVYVRTAVIKDYREQKKETIGMLEITLIIKPKSE
jgi:PAS domain S-box-containing protein